MAGIRSAAIAATLVFSAGSAQGLTISFDYRFDTRGFFTDAWKSLLQQAGEISSTRVTDSFNAVGRTSTSIDNPGGTGGKVRLEDFTAPADMVTVFVGGRDMGSSMLGMGGSLYSLNHRGEGQGDFAPLFGTISFNSAASWYVDTDPGTTESFSGSDFFPVALHELTHGLGVGVATSWSDKLVGSPGNYTSFSGTYARSVFGGRNPWVTADGGHWKEGVQSTVNGTAQEAAMDPALTSGTRKLLTDLDWAVLQDIGWELALVPEPTPAPLPPAVWLLGSGIAVIWSLAHQRATVRGSAAARCTA